jgi:hypothetical protein
LGDIGEPGSQQIRNPLADKAYQSNLYLTEDFIERVDAVVAEAKAGDDPFLCAETTLRCITADEAAMNDDQATVMVHEIWYSRVIIHDVEVELNQLHRRSPVYG